MLYVIRFLSLALLPAALFSVMGCNSDSASPKIKRINLSNQGTITVDGYPCAIEPKESHLAAHLARGKVSWELHVKAKHSEAFDDYDEDSNAPLAAPVVYVYFQSATATSWRELPESSTKVVYETEPELLPDNPAGAYLGYHLFPNNHIIKFGVSQGNLVEIDWTCNARESEFSEPKRFHTFGVLQFKYVDIGIEEILSYSKLEPRTEGTIKEATPQVEFDSHVDAKNQLEAANSLLTQHFDLKWFGKPEVFEWGVRFPAK